MDTPRLIRLLEYEPDLAAGVAVEAAAAAQRHTVAPVLTLAPGSWSPEELCADPVTGPFAVLVLDGLIARDTVLADRVATQLVGPGDVIGLRGWDDGSPPAGTEWRVAAPTNVAVLDSRFLGAAQRWPWLTARVVARSLRWGDRAAMLQAITQLGRVELRLIALFWHLADRWGHMTADGVVVPLRLTHEMLGRLVGAQRPTVTLALHHLRRQGVLSRAGTGWRLAADSRELREQRPAPAALVRESGEGGIRTLERG